MIGGDVNGRLWFCLGTAVRERRCVKSHALWLAQEKHREKKAKTRKMQNLGTEVLIAAFLVSSVEGALADDLVLEGVTVASAEQCLATLTEFNWYCRFFDYRAEDSLTRHTFWEAGHMVVYQHDFDHDGKDDLLVRVAGLGQCGSGCPYVLLYADLPAARQYVPSMILSVGPPTIASSNGVEGLVFSEMGEYFWSLPDVRKFTLDYWK